MRWTCRVVVTALGAVCLLAGLRPGWTAPAARSTADAPPRVFLQDAQFLLAVRQRVAAADKALAPAVGQLEREAQQALHAGPFSVVDKKPTPPSGDKHDYMSQAPYFWPNPDTSNGLPYIRRDGERNPEIGRISDHRRLDEMAGAVETLALAYFFKSDEAYADKAAKLLRAWFFDPATRMNPNLQYAQFIPGVNTGRGIGLIETRSLIRVVDAVGLLAGSQAWPEADQQGLQAWYAQFLGWMQESKNGHEEAAARNNHGTYYDVQAVSFALFLGRTNLAADIVRTACQKRIAVQIEPDGRQSLELVRTKAWSYSVGNLSGLMLLATLGENVGADLWHYRTQDGRSIAKALDYLAQFAMDGQKWPHQQLGGLHREALNPLLREAASKFPEGKYRDWAKKLPPYEPGNRANLLRPKLPDVPEGHE